MKFLLVAFLLILSNALYAQDAIKIESVENKIIMGPQAGNKDLSFGVKNILEEIIQDNGYNLSPTAKKSIQVELIFFDVKKITSNIAVYSKNQDITEIIAKGTLLEDGKKLKSVVVKEQAKTVTTATVIIDKGGKISESDISAALKKVCEGIITKLLQ
jgi:hypothetical protein